MRKCILLFTATILWSTSVHANFAIFQTSLDSPAVTTCNVITGIATGLDAGTCAASPPVCDGVADDKAGFVTINTWARATTTNTNGQLLELYVPPGKTCSWLSGGFNQNFVMTGIKNGRLMGYGSTFRSPSGLGYGLGPSYRGICQAGLSDPSGCSARLTTVSAGATSVTLLDTALCSRFTAGQWALVAGLTLQGTYNVPGGFPPNPHFFDFVQITSTTSCAGTGQITFSPALTNSYLSTWPNYNSGSAIEADDGGPATIYALDANWGGTSDIRGLTLSNGGAALGGPGYSVSLRDVTFSESPCYWPSQNKTTSFTNTLMTNCFVEMDKIIGTVRFDNVTVGTIQTQSSSVDNMILNNVTAINSITGTPKVATMSNVITPNLQLGPTGYGIGTSASCTNCSITNVISNSGYTVQGPAEGNNIGANNTYTVSGGVFSIPDYADVTGFADNGSGFVRLTVASTAGWSTGWGAGNNGILTGCPGTCPPGIILTVVDGTHFDTNLAFASYTWTGAGKLVNAASRWAIPGANFAAAGGGIGPSVTFEQVTGVTQDSSGTHIATTLSGGFPTVPLSSGRANLATQMLHWTCSGCSGNAQAVDWAGAPPNIPFASYSNRTWSNSTALPTFPLWGKVTSIKLNVTQDYTGTTNPLRFDFVENTVVPAGTSSFWVGRVNLRQAGLRTITPAGVTCDTGGGPVAGMCSGDSGLTLPDPDAFFAANLNPQKNDGSPTDQPWSISAEFIMDQGVVP